jgi:hypothetical protein
MKEWNAEEYNKIQAEDFAREYCKMVDDLFIENLKNTDGQINIANLLQSCIDTTSQGYGFKANE